MISDIGRGTLAFFLKTKFWPGINAVFKKYRVRYAAKGCQKLCFSSSERSSSSIFICIFRLFRLLYKSAIFSTYRAKSTFALLFALKASCR